MRSSRSLTVRVNHIEKVLLVEVYVGEGRKEGFNGKDIHCRVDDSHPTAFSRNDGKPFESIDQQVLKQPRSAGCFPQTPIPCNLRPLPSVRTDNKTFVTPLSELISPFSPWGNLASQCLLLLRLHMLFPIQAALLKHILKVHRVFDFYRRLALELFAAPVVQVFGHLQLYLHRRLNARLGQNLS